MLATVKVIRKKPTTQVAAPTYNQNTGTWNTGSAFTTVLDDVKARIQPYGIMGDMVVPLRNDNAETKSFGIG